MDYSELLKWADEPETEENKEFVDSWFAALEKKDEELNSLAIWLAKSFLSNEIDYEIANTILNQVMPVVGFEEAPKIFWKFYIAFEDFETSTNPNAEARLRIQSELEAINGI